MPDNHIVYFQDRSAEWKYWRDHYRAKGVTAYNKLNKLVSRKMGYR